VNASLFTRAVRSFLLILLALPLSYGTRPLLAQANLTSTVAGVALEQQAQATNPIGHFGGSIVAVAVDGNYAYIGEGASLIILDISVPTSPAVVGRVVLPDSPWDIVIASDYAYVADWPGGFVVVDVSNPAEPVIVGSYETQGNAFGVAVVGNYAYVAHSYGLSVIDVSDPANPTEAGSYSTAAVAWGVDAAGNYVYLANGTDGLQILDVSNPANPTFAGSYAAAGYDYCSDVVVVGNTAYVADGLYGVRVLDVSNPATPTETGAYTYVGANAKDVTVVWPYAYVADPDIGFLIADVSNPANPTHVGWNYSIEDPQNVAVTGSHAYLTTGDDGLRVMDVSHPANPTEATAYNPQGKINTVAVIGTKVYAAGAGKLNILEVSDPAIPTVSGTYSPFGSADIDLLGDYAYSASGADGLQILDVSNPANPMEASVYDTPGDGYGVYVKGNLAYVADGFLGVQIIDVSNPNAPTSLGSYDTNWAWNVYVSGSYAYVADSIGLRILNVADPANISEAGFYETAADARDVIVEGHYAYLSTAVTGLVVLDISDPANPAKAGAYSLPGHAYGLALADGYAYLTYEPSHNPSKPAGLGILDVSNPAQPVSVGSYDLPGWPRKVAVSGDYVYVAGADRGLLVIKYAPIRLSEVRPNMGPAGWENDVMVCGENLTGPFSANTSLLLGSTPISATLVSDTQLRATVPAALTVGIYSLYASNPEGVQATLADAYTVVEATAGGLYAHRDELWTDPTAPRATEATQVGLVVHRVGGTGTLTDVSVDFYIGNPTSGGTLLGTGTIAELEPSSYASTTGVTWTPDFALDYSIYATIGSSEVSVNRTVTVLPSEDDPTPPTINSFTINGATQNQNTPSRSVTLNVSASDQGSGVGAIYIIEFDWNKSVSSWVPSQESGWMPYSGATTSNSWTMVNVPGLKNFVVWAADRAGNITRLGKPAWINYVGTPVYQGQAHLYGYFLNGGQSFTAVVTPSSGDPDLYIGDTSGAAHGTSIQDGTVAETVSFTAPATDLYTVVVYGYTTSNYQLTTSGALKQARDDRDGYRTQSAHDPPDYPLFIKASAPPLQQALPSAPIGYHVYLPLVLRNY